MFVSELRRAIAQTSSCSASQNSGSSAKTSRSVSAPVLSPSTVRLAMQYVSSLFATAVSDRYIPSNPAKGAKLPKVERAPIVPPTPSDIIALREAAPAWFAVAVALASGAGLRQGEATGLTADRVDFLRRELRIDRQLAPLPPAVGDRSASDRRRRTTAIATFRSRLGWSTSWPATSRGTGPVNMV